ncbi:MAG TPA: prepilin-type N-terminal cleavage/methylation domain-containing protein [Acidobacteriota bacterium]|nr:prepilin-type N-terminal cleavage/methylation domain-containing protein [Acidobacteriota bacterium]
MNERGFQLIELLLVVAILAVAGAIGAGVYSRLTDHYRLQQGGFQVAGLLRSARTLALAGAAPLEVVPGPDGRGLGLRIGQAPPLRWIFLPQQVRLVSAPRRPLRFFSRGQAAPAGRFRLQGRFGSLDVIVAPWGRVRQAHVDEEKEAK